MTTCRSPSATSWTGCSGSARTRADSVATPTTTRPSSTRGSVWMLSAREPTARTRSSASRTVTVRGMGTAAGVIMRPTDPAGKPSWAAVIRRSSWPRPARARATTLAGASPSMRARSSWCIASTTSRKPSSRIPASSRCWSNGSSSSKTSIAVDFGSPRNSTAAATSLSRAIASAISCGSSSTSPTLSPMGPPVSWRAGPSSHSGESPGGRPAGAGVRRRDRRRSVPRACRRPPHCPTRRSPRPLPPPPAT